MKMNKDLDHLMLTKQTLYPIVSILQLTDKLSWQLLAVDLLLKLPIWPQTARPVVVVVAAAALDPDDAAGLPPVEGARSTVGQEARGGGRDDRIVVLVKIVGRRDKLKQKLGLFRGENREVSG